MANGQLEDYALIVGIDDYSDQQQHPPLKGAKNDALEFEKWLRKVAKVKNIFMLLSKEDGSAPKLSDVWVQIDSLLKLSPTGDERIGRRLYIFMAGHGVGPDIDEAGLVTTEDSETLKVYVPGQRCANTFRAGAYFEEIILFMDCCRDFDSSAPSLPWPFKTKADPGPADKVKRLYLFASGFGRKSQEKVFGGKMHGEFSRALIDALDGKAPDGKGRITGASIEKHLRKRLIGWKPLVVDPDIVFLEGLQPTLGKVKVTLPDTATHLKIVTGLGMKPVAAPVKNQGGAVREVDLPIDEMFIFQAFDGAGNMITQTSEEVREEGADVKFP